LLVSKFLPLPDNSGGKQRTLAIVRRLLSRGKVTLCAYDDGGADHDGLARLGVDVRSVPWGPTPRTVAAGVLRTGSLTAGRFWHPQLVEHVRRAAAEAPLDLVQVECLQMAPAVRGITADRRVLDLENVESALTASYARTRRGLASVPFHVEAAAQRSLERKAAKAFDTVVVVSDQEAARWTPTGSPVLVCPNAWDSSDVLPPAATPTAAFVATMGWAPNTDAALWLGQEIWPRVSAVLPDARLLLVGRDPPPSVEALSSLSIEVSGAVQSVRPLLARARVALAPLRAGGGTRLKILEALDCGRPVVATSLAVDGLEDLVGRGVVLADDAPTMAASIVDLLRHPAAAQELGRTGHDAVAGDHSWDIALAPLFSAIAS
jgi:glycosyltransferase involved in cell wall biosynthesis